MQVRRLIAAVYVKDPTTHENLILLPGESPALEIAALVTNPDAWDGPLQDHAETELIAVGEPDPAASGAAPDSGQGEAGGGGAKKSPSRRTRSSSA
ncbi:hypothetical protein TPA0910_29580 [Streptomyces hygroscopicus subsp. sporocinereus]|uniref:Transposase n=1 Tax=Streptomyces hygroscopicus TaxID=1912 RepID=A0ABQ3TYV1_STRHY|nr:hypothetical protein [Streptomyces hygroscopicus]GHJ28525.1 hypothetical protein TPA0910_29580 [Streptomyces hygroscopicus]